MFDWIFSWINKTPKGDSHDFDGSRGYARISHKSGRLAGRVIARMRGEGDASWNRRKHETRNRVSNDLRTKRDTINYEQF